MSVTNFSDAVRICIRKTEELMAENATLKRQANGLKAQISKLSGEKRKAEKEVFDLKVELKESQETYEGLVSRVEDIIGVGNNMADELQHLRKKHKELGESVFENFRKERGLD